MCKSEWAADKNTRREVIDSFPEYLAAALSGSAAGLCHAARLSSTSLARMLIASKSVSRGDALQAAAGWLRPWLAAPPSQSGSTPGLVTPWWYRPSSALKRGARFAPLVAWSGVTARGWKSKFCERDGAAGSMAVDWNRERWAAAYTHLGICCISASAAFSASAASRLCVVLVPAALVLTNLPATVALARGARCGSFCPGQRRFIHDPAVPPTHGTANELEIHTRADRRSRSPAASAS